MCLRSPSTALAESQKRVRAFPGTLRRRGPKLRQQVFPHSEGGKICECEQSFLNNEIQSFLLFISQYSMLAQTFYLPLRREGDRRRVPGNALTRFWGSGDGGGGRDIICLCSHLWGFAPANVTMLS